jgi:glycosyltransferase involved in cell wall biosynthesis
VDEEYFTEKIQSLFRDPLVEFVGEIDEAQKDEFLGNAFAYLFPINWPKPFGITMIEAMACGTPVIAMSHGSVPEVVVDGRTGFICGSMAEMIASVQKIDRLDGRACRMHVAGRFLVERMTDGSRLPEGARGAGRGRLSDGEGTTPGGHVVIQRGLGDSSR